MCETWADKQIQRGLLKAEQIAVLQIIQQRTQNESYIINEDYFKNDNINYAVNLFDVFFSLLNLECFRVTAVCVNPAVKGLSQKGITRLATLKEAFAEEEAHKNS